MSYGLRGLDGRVYGLGRVGLGDNVVGQTSGDYTWDGRQWVLSSTGLPPDVTSGNLQQAVQESQAAGIPVNVPASMGPATPLMSYYDLLAQAHLANCDPRDSACVSNNTAKQAAVEDYWVSHKETVPVGTVLSFTPQSAAQVNEFYNASNPTGGDVVDTSGILHVVSAPAAGGGSSSSGAGTAAGSAGSAAAGGSAAGSSSSTAGSSSSGATAEGSPALSPTLNLPTVGGFDLNTIPWWGWAAGAFVAFFAFGGANGGRRY